jgi:hypothetical protein
MKSTDNFKKVISDHLEIVASKDAIFAETLKKESKNIDECVNYILSEVQKSGCSGFTDDEIFGMAIHYYDEDDIQPGKPFKGQVIVNHHVELSQEEIQKAKAKAIQEVVAEEKQRIRKKTTVKKETSENVQVELF